jgi:L-amino acid N-acyltransferase YncA
LKQQNLVAMADVHIRKMLDADWDKVKMIYEGGMATGLATFETKSSNWIDWDKSHHKHFGRLVAIIQNDIGGWAALSPVSSRSAYSGLAEISIYIAEEFRGMGLGKLLLLALVAESEKNGIWTLQSLIFTDNIASIKLHESLGFRRVGIREKIAKRNGEWKNNYIYERRSKVVT